MVKRYALDSRQGEMFEIASGYYVAHDDYATLEAENAKLRDLLRGEAAVAEECAKIVEEPSGEYSVGHRRLPYWDGAAKAAEIRKRFGGKA